MERDLTTGHESTDETWHSHLCPECGSEWTHRDAFCEVEAGMRGQSAVCPLCER